MTLTPSRTEKLDMQTTGIAPTNGDFPVSAPAANPVFYRTYSRRLPKGRESWHEVGERNRSGLLKLGSLNAEEMDLLARMQGEKISVCEGQVLNMAWNENTSLLAALPRTGQSLNTALCHT